MEIRPISFRWLSSQSGIEFVRSKIGVNGENPLFKICPNCRSFQFSWQDSKKEAWLPLQRYSDMRNYFRMMFKKIAEQTTDFPKITSVVCPKCTINLNKRGGENK